MKRITKKVLWTAALTLAVWGAKAQSAGDLVEQVRARYAPDKRVAVFEIEAEQVNDTLYILKGKCDDPEAVRALRERLRRGGPSSGLRICSTPSARRRTISPGPK